MPKSTNSSYPKVELYIAVKCKNIYRVTNNDNRKKEEEENHTQTHTQYKVPARFELEVVGTRVQSANRH